MSESQHSASNAICLSVDQNFLVPALVLAKCLCEAVKSQSLLVDVFVFCRESQITDAARDFAESSEFQLLSDLDYQRLSDISGPNHRLTKAAFDRLLLAERFADNYKKVLYLDTDIAIHNNICALFNLDMGSKPFAAVRAGRLWAGQLKSHYDYHQQKTKALGMVNAERYFNTGVLLINPKEWTKNDVAGKAIEFYLQNRDECTLADEHALNAVIDGDFSALSPVWNHTRNGILFDSKDFSIEPVVTHFVGPDKPWRKFNVNQKFVPNLRYYNYYQVLFHKHPFAKKWLQERQSFRQFVQLFYYPLYRRLRVNHHMNGPKFPANPEGYLYHFLKDSGYSDVEQGIVEIQENRMRLSSDYGVSTDNRYFCPNFG